MAGEPRVAPSTAAITAEFVGTFTLIFVGAGSIIATGQILGQTPTDVAALLAIAFAHGLALATMISALGHVSGAHFNPAVTFGAVITGKIDVITALVYWAAQLAGATVGALALRFLIPKVAWKAVQLGTPALGGGIKPWPAIGLEAILTFFLVWVVFATAIDEEGAFNKIAGLAIGFVVLMDILVAGPWTGGAMNPARAFGPALISGHWKNFAVYVVGPLLGGGAAALLYDRVVLATRSSD